MESEGRPNLGLLFCSAKKKRWTYFSLRYKLKPQFPELWYGVSNDLPFFLGQCSLEAQWFPFDLALSRLVCHLATIEILPSSLHCFFLPWLDCVQYSTFFSCPVLFWLALKLTRFA